MAKKKLGVNPWTHIWFHPRETLQKVVKFNPKYRFLFLSFLYGIPMLLHMAQNFSLGEQYTFVGIVIGSIILGTFVGMLGLTISSALILWTGKWIGGEANYYGVRSAVSWSNVPNIISIFVWICMIFAFRTQLFHEGFQDQSFQGGDLIFVSGSLFVQLILSIWSFIILVKGLGEVQKFSAWKGVLNVLIAFLLIGALSWLLTWMFWSFNGMPAAA